MASMARVYRTPVGRRHRQQAIRMVGRGTDRRSRSTLLYKPVDSFTARPLLGVYVDDDFRRRGPRVGLTITLFVCLVMFLVAVVWFNR